MADRIVDVHATAASELKGANSPYLKISLGDHTVKTKAVSGFGENPVSAKNKIHVVAMSPVFGKLFFHFFNLKKQVWDEHFNITLPVAKPNERPFDIHVEAKTEVPVLPNMTVGVGSASLSQLFSHGDERARIELHDGGGNPAGVVHLHLKVVEETGKVPYAAGTVMGEGVVAKPEGLAAEGKATAEVVPTTSVAPATPVLGAASPGMIEDPSKPTYGIL